MFCLGFLPFLDSTVYFLWVFEVDDFSAVTLVALLFPSSGAFTSSTLGGSEALAAS